MRIHHAYTQARNFVDYLEVYSTRLSDDLQSIVYKVVSPIKTTIKLFDELLNEGIQSLTEVTKEGNFDFNILGGSHGEENEDLKVSLLKSLIWFRRTPRR